MKKKHVALFIKKIVSFVLYITGISSVFIKFSNYLNSDYIRVINYHSVPADKLDNMSLQIKKMKKYYDFITLDELKLFLKGDFNLAHKPGILITFDDGFIDNYYCAKNLLDKEGIKGVFFVSSEKINNSEKKYMKTAHLLELQDEGHSICNHTYSHHRFSTNDSESVIVLETVEANKQLNEALGIHNDVFCWVGGEMGVYQKKVFNILRENFKYIFTTCTQKTYKNTNPLMIHRTNIEASWNMPLTLFQISGLWDLYYIKKARSVESLLNK